MFKFSPLLIKNNNASGPILMSLIALMSSFRKWGPTESLQKIMIFLGPDIPFVFT